MSSPRRTHWRGPLRAEVSVDSTRANYCRPRLRRRRGYLDASAYRKRFDPPTKYGVAREPTDTSWHENVLYNKKFMTWNAPVLCTKQAVYYLSFGRSNIFTVTSTCNALSSRRFTNLSKTSRSSVWFMVAVSFLIVRFGSCVVCQRLLYTPYFKCPHRKKSGTVSSGGCARKCCSSLINTLHTALIRC